MAIEITVNGRHHRVTAAPDTPLLLVLRNDLQLNGPKFGCGLAQCGACIVHLDGEAVPACVTPLSEVAGRSVVTIELQQAFLDEQAAQCGYCTAGIIMKAAENGWTVYFPGSSAATQDMALWGRRTSPTP